MSKSEPNAVVVVLPDSPEAATYRTDIKGWVDRSGRFYGEDERAARYGGSTHRSCSTIDCDNIFAKNCGYTTCQKCRDKADHERYFHLKEAATWEYPLCLWRDDKFFWDEDDIQYYCEDHFCQPKDLQLVTTETNHFKEFNPYDYYEDQIPESDDGRDYKFPKEIAEAFDKLNEVLRGYTTPLSYYSGNKRVTVDFEVELEPTQIIVNGEWHDIYNDRLTYKQVVELAGFTEGDKPTVTFRNGYAGRRGELSVQESVFIINGTTLNVANTRNA